MTKIILLIGSLVCSSYMTFAGSGAAAPPNNTENHKTWLYKPLASNDVSLEVERIEGNVQMYLYSQNMRNVDMIYVEKSKDPTGGFTRCKSIRVAENLIKSKNYIAVVDDKPYDSSTDSYYRIRTVSSSGATRVYPVVGLSPIMAIENEIVDNR